MKKKFIFTLAITLMLIFACNKQETSDQTNKAHVNSRSGNPGNYSITNGIIIFPTWTDLEQTINFIRQSPSTNRAIWESGLSIETTGKAYSSFMQQLENISESEDNSLIENLESSFLGKIRIRVDPDIEDSRTYLPKYRMFNDFVNLDGVFQIGQIIFKVTGMKLITINLTLCTSNINLLDNNTVTNLENGIYVDDIVSQMPPPCCEGLIFSKECKFDVGTYGRRFVIDMQMNRSTASFITNGVRLFQLWIDDGFIQTKHQQRKALFGWYGQKVDSRLTHTLQATWSIPAYGITANIFPVPNPLVQTVTHQVYNTIISGSKKVAEIIADTRPLNHSFCLLSYRNEITRLSNWYTCIDQCN